MEFDCRWAVEAHTLYIMIVITHRYYTVRYTIAFLYIVQGTVRFHVQTMYNISPLLCKT